MKPHLKSSPETCAWGYFDASSAPVLIVESGDTIVIETVTGSPDQIPHLDAGYDIPPELFDIHERSERQLPGYILTGPVTVAGRMKIVEDPKLVPQVQTEVQEVINAAEGCERPMIGIERFDFYDRARESYAMIQTGERRFYGCFMFRKGVIPPEEESQHVK